jgi:aerobic C4-dicarboxylate transport protein
LAGALLQLGGLIVTFLGTAAAFIVLVLGAIAWAHGFSLFRLLAYLRSELLLVFGTSSSEAALPALIERLEEMGRSGGGGCGGPRGLFVQPGWHEYLHDAGRAVHCAGGGD